MRIAYICADPGIPVFGTKGASVHVQEVVGVLIATGHSVDLFAARTGDSIWPNLRQALERGQLTVHELPRPKEKDDPGSREKALMAADGENARIVAASGNFDLVYERYSLWSKSCLRQARDRRIPTVLEVNAPLPLEQARHRRLVHVSEAEQVICDAGRYATVVMCVSRPVADWVEERLSTVVADDVSFPKVIVEANGVNVDRLRPVRSPDSETFTVGFVGTLKPWHGTRILVDAFAAVHEARSRSRLLLVGDGPERENLERQCRELGLGAHVEFTGAVSPQEIPGLLARMDVGVAPYPVSEKDNYFSPLKVYEYMAAGLPVVASDVGQLPEILTDGWTGILVPGSDPAQLADALLCLEDDREFRHFLGREARLQVGTHHTWHKVVERTLRAATSPPVMVRGGEAMRREDAG